MKDLGKSLIKISRSTVKDGSTRNGEPGTSTQW